MKLTLCCAILATAVSGSVASGGKFDVKIENAARGMIARRIGELRGGFGFRQQPSMSAPVNPNKAFQPPAAGSWQIVTSRDPVDVSTFGSIQTFSDGSAPTRQQRKALARKKVSRIIKY